MELATFSIPTFRQFDIQKRLEKLARKASQYGNGDITFSFGETKVVAIKTEFGFRDYEFVDITVSGEAPQIEGWQLLARVELYEGDENLIHSVPGSNENLNPMFRTHNGHCDHCNTARRRNDVYVLTDGSEQIAVGRTCLRDFLGIDDPKSIVNRAQFFEELREIQDEDMIGSFGSHGYFDLKEVLLYAAAYIRKEGYVSKAKQMEEGWETTGDKVSATIKNVPGYSVEVKPEDREWVSKTVDYFRRDTAFGNDYMDNIRVIMKQDIVKKTHVALIASAVITAQRQIAKKTQKGEVKPSNFVGEVKQRLKNLNLIIEKIIFLGDGMWGPSYLHLFKDETDNTFSWITSTKIELPEGSTLLVDGTVKQHKVYNGTNQTVLSRVKVK